MEKEEYPETNNPNIKLYKYKDNIFIIPLPNDKPVKVIYEYNGCKICNEMQEELRKTKIDGMIIKTYECKNCGREFLV